MLTDETMQQHVLLKLETECWRNKIQKITVNILQQ